MKQLFFSRNIMTLAAILAVLSGCGDTSIETSSQEPDPVVVDVPIAFIKRTLPVDDNGQAIAQDLRNPSQFLPGAALFIKARASATEVEVNLTDRAFAPAEGTAPEPYDVKDLEASYDGTRLLFSMRAPALENVNDDEQPTWNIWEYNRNTDQLRRIIGSELVAESGQDTSPVYLADGRIMFSSTRQRTNQAILIDEGKPQYQGLEESLRRPASVLHVMRSDGTEIEQVSFNQSHDLDPLVLSNGKVLFSRWDQAGSNKGIHLYQMNPNGSDLQIVYGLHSHRVDGISDAIHFVQTRETPDNRILTKMLPFQRSLLGTDIIEIDVAGFIDNTTPIAGNSGTGPAQQSALFDNVRLDLALSPGGYFSSVYPLWDGSERRLFTWSQCRVFDPEQEQTGEEERKVLPCSEELLAREDIQRAPELYGLWMFDPLENTQLALAVPEEGVAYTEAVAMEARPVPANAPEIEEFDIELSQRNSGAIHIRSVYDFAGVDNSGQGIVNVANPSLVSADNRPAQFLRVVKGVSIPDRDTLNFNASAFGRSRGQLMREIIGYVPIQPDGSVTFEVPANIPFAISVLNQFGQRIGERHNNWLQVAAGEVKNCNGCHSRNNTAPHGRALAEAASINQGAASNGAFPGANPSLTAQMGETMAQTISRINGLLYPQPDIEFEDVWVDAATTAPATAFTLQFTQMQTPVPISPSCGQNWTNLCRIVVNYPTHIQPIFDLLRVQMDELGNVLSDQTCVSCHSPTDDQGLAKVPAAQLELGDTPSNQNPNQVTSYRELMFADNEQEVIDGALIDRLVQRVDGNGDPVFETDEDGELILDEEGNPIPVLDTVRVFNSVSTAGALRSGRFFSPFAQGGSHQSWLTPVEIKLLSEWMDIGAQYYNNPFDAPVN